MALAAVFSASVLASGDSNSGNSTELKSPTATPTATATATARTGVAPRGPLDLTATPTPTATPEIAPDDAPQASTDGSTDAPPETFAAAVTDQPPPAEGPGDEPPPTDALPEDPPTGETAPTQAPPTAVPPTEVPATPVPPTSVPPTQAPSTAVPPTAVPPTPTTAPQPPAATGFTGMESAMFQAHNQQRSANGLSGLQADSTLNAIARERAQDMATKGYFSHTSPSGETAFTVMGGYGYGYAAAGENIARNNYPQDQSVSVAMNGFMASAGHRQNILESRFTKVGIGVAVGSNGMIYYAVVFAG